VGFGDEHLVRRTRRHALAARLVSGVVAAVVDKKESWVEIFHAWPKLRRRLKLRPFSFEGVK
jgi:hypothetical protein